MVRHRPDRVSVAGVALLVVAAALGGGWLLIGKPAGSFVAVKDTATQNAMQVAVDVNAYDYRSLNQHFTTVAGELTGSILADFNKEKVSIAASFTQAKATSQAKVLDAATVPPAAHAGDEASVLVAVQVVYTPAGGVAVPQTELLKMHLVHTGGRWLVDGIVQEI